MAGDLPVTVEIDFPMYVIADEETGDVLVAAEEVDGFFLGPGEESSEVVFLRAYEVNKSRRRVEDAVLQVVNRRREKVGEYFIGRVMLDGIGEELSDGKISIATYRFSGSHCDYRQAATIWRRWASDAPLEKGEWIQWPLAYRDAWLHVVQNSWFSLNRRAARYGDNEVAYLDGRHISTKASFYCALGEAVNGPGGYFGSNLDALADCLSSNFGVGPLVKIVWQNFQASRESLDDAFLRSIMTIARELNVDFVTR